MRSSPSGGQGPVHSGLPSLFSVCTAPAGTFPAPNEAASSEMPTTDQCT